MLCPSGPGTTLLPHRVSRPHMATGYRRPCESFRSQRRCRPESERLCSALCGWFETKALHGRQTLTHYLKYARGLWVSAVQRQCTPGRQFPSLTWVRPIEARPRRTLCPDGSGSAPTRWDGTANEWAPAGQVSGWSIPNMFDSGSCRPATLVISFGVAAERCCSACAAKPTPSSWPSCRPCLCVTTTRIPSSSPPCARSSFGGVLMKIAFKRQPPALRQAHAPKATAGRVLLLSAVSIIREIRGGHVGTSGLAGYEHRATPR
jgi:hypothetical protein